MAPRLGFSWALWVSNVIILLMMTLGSWISSSSPDERTGSSSAGLSSMAWRDSLLAWTMHTTVSVSARSEVLTRVKGKVALEASLSHPPLSASVWSCCCARWSWPRSVRCGAGRSATPPAGCAPAAAGSWSPSAPPDTAPAPQEVQPWGEDEVNPTVITLIFDFRMSEWMRKLRVLNTSITNIVWPKKKKKSSADLCFLTGLHNLSGLVFQFGEVFWELCHQLLVLLQLSLRTIHALLTLLQVATEATFTERC